MAGVRQGATASQFGPGKLLLRGLGLVASLGAGHAHRATPDYPMVAFWTFCVATLVGAGNTPAAAETTASVQDLSGLSIEELANVEITSVAKRAEPLSGAPAAIFVITREDIRRSGATSLPEALRLAPNLDVARLGSSSYAITARGFNHETGTANKLLVLIDGRTVYTPLFAGVFWDAQDVMLDDIERIEVISGPGGALWGSNAVNGVINIVTRNSRDSQGGLIDVGYGNLDRTINARYGGTLGDNATFRVYAMGAQNDSLVTLSNHDAKDAWNKIQGGFRMDWKQAEDSITLQGDAYDGANDNTPPGSISDGTISGGNILGRWNRLFDDGSNLTTQIYFDNARRTEVSGIAAVVNTYDFDAQYSFSIGAHNAIVVGGGYRIIDDKLTPGPHTAFLIPASLTSHLANIFAHDEIALDRDLTLTLGLKLEDNSYTGLEYMPDARLAWHLSDKNMLWLAVSRAVRTPSRFDRDLYATGLLAGGPDFQSEDLVAYEAGYRAEPLPSLSFSISAYYNVYDKLRTLEASGPHIFPLVIKNNMKGDTYGVELWGNYAVRDWWRLSAGFNTLRKNLSLEPGSLDVFGVQFAGNDPNYQFSLRSAMDIGDFELDAGLRSIAKLPSPAVPSYIEADARIGWRVSDKLALSLTGNNLLHDHHLEFINPSLPAEAVPRSVFISARWRL